MVPVVRRSRLSILASLSARSPASATLQEPAVFGGGYRAQHDEGEPGLADASWFSGVFETGAPMAIDDFKGTKPLFLPEQFFVGRLEGWAVLETIVGGLLKRATIKAHGEFELDTQTVLFTENYTFNDGHSDTLHWTIRKGEEGKYTGLENRLEGEAIGEQAGCAFHWKYTRDTPQAGGKSTRLNFDDWFYAIDDRACIVRGSAGRAGIPFATAHVTYRKL